MTKVAIYARYSTDKQDDTSITGQIRSCREHAKAHNLKVASIFKDEALSGKDDNRPGFQDMIAALERKEFDGILIEEVDRLTRRPGTLLNLLEDLVFRDQFLITTKDEDSRREGAELVYAIKGALSAEDIKKIIFRTRRGLRERFDKGCSAGGISYGYLKPKNNEVRTWWKKQINPKEAEIVREIFQMYADGMSPRAIAAELNARGVPSPGAKWKRNGGKTSDGKWRANAINGDLNRGTGILCNELYRGKYVWNRTEWRREPGTKKRKCITRPKSEWMDKTIPELRIVDDALWCRVQARRQEVAKKSRNIREALGKKCGPGRSAKYLLSGVLKCGVCGRNYIMRDRRSYKCSSHTNGGKHACKNDITVKRTLVEETVLATVHDKLLSPAVIKQLRKDIVRLVKEEKGRRAAADPRSELKTGLAEAERRLANLADAVGDRGYTDHIKSELDKWEQERDELAAQLETTPKKLDSTCPESGDFACSAA